MKYSPAEIIREYGPFPGVEAIHGVSYDGQRTWFASGDRMNALRIDPETAKFWGGWSYRPARSFPVWNRTVATASFAAAETRQDPSATPT